MKKTILKISLVPVSVMLCLCLLSALITPKWIGGNNPQTYQTGEFADLEPNTLDVLVLGSCQSYQGFNTAVLWEKAHLTSYVLASPDQRLYSTYHYLKYALKTQSPKIVLIDTLMLAESNEESEGFDSKALYSLKDTSARLEFARDIFDLHYKGNKRLPKYYLDKAVCSVKAVFPVLAFCSTFDFSYDYAIYYLRPDTITYNGSVPMYIRMDMSPKGGYMTDNCTGKEKIDPDADLYFRKIVELCSQNNAELVLYKTVSPYYWSNEKYRVVADYAEGFGIEYLDFNVDPASYGFDLSRHLYERWKMNADGMRLTTELLADQFMRMHPEWSEAEKSASVTAYYDSMLDRYNQAYEAADWKTADIPE